MGEVCTDSIMHEETQQESIYGNEMNAKPVPETTTQLNLDVNRSISPISKHFSTTKKMVYCVTGICIGVIVVVTLITLAVTRNRSNDGVEPNPENLWMCTIAGDNSTKLQCEGFGCRYNESYENHPEYPKCFYPITDFGYYVESIDRDGTLQLYWRTKPIHETQITALTVQVVEYSNDIFRVVIKDPKHKRYEVPIKIEPKGAKDLTSKLYEVQTSGIGEQFWVLVRRRSSNELLFDTRNTTLVFLDQFLEITTTLPSERFYGMAERGAPFARSMNYVTMPLFAHDNYPSPIGQDINLYSSQPFYMVVENNGDAHGVMIYNSNAMEVYLTPAPSITLRALGGIFDMYFFLGPTPIDVTKQLTDIVGKPFMPPYWSIGFHLCRYGYNSLQNTKVTFKRNWDKGLPMDVQWQDIDYMDEKLIFTIDNKMYLGLKTFVDDDLHNNSVKYVIIVDPAVGQKEGFDVYERGLFEDVYIKNATGQDIIGKVWPGNTVFPDFTNEKTNKWWKDEMYQFHNELPYDGIWLDMNEPANFDSSSDGHGKHGSIYGCQKNEINYPLYKPNTAGEVMFHKTLCLDAKQAWGIQRDLHNIYGLTETIATFNALKARFSGKRPFIISRSTFLGSGKFAGHWLGDNVSNWKHLRQSIIGVLDFNMLGIPMTGADIGGFAGDVTEQLAIRWHQLGAWYPFCRNHNSIDSTDQDPAIFSEDAFQKIKRAIEIRYELLPYWYTRFARSHTTGEPIIRATFQNFPKEKKLLAKDFDNSYTQFMVGDSILVAPVVTEDATETKVYLPTSSGWFKHYQGTYTFHSAGDSTVEVPMDELPYFIRAGVILFNQMKGQTTTARQNEPYEIVVLPDENNKASGYIYIDDGEKESSDYAIVKISYAKDTIKFSAITYGSFDIQGNYGDVLILSVKKDVTTVTIDGEAVAADGFEYKKESHELIIQSKSISTKTIGEMFAISF